MRQWALSAAVLGLAACDMVAGGRAAPGDCGAAGLQSLVGQGDAALAAITFPVDAVRFIEPGMAVTQDFNPERLNIIYDEAGLIAEVKCG